MTAVILDKSLERQIVARRRRLGIDHHDEVWDGVYVMAPAADTQHQDIAADLVEVLRNVVRTDRLGECFPGINISDRKVGWRKNFRCPDAALFLRGNLAEDCETFWFGGPDLALEIVSPNDRTRKKIPFYEKVGTRELLVVDRRPWRLTLFRLGSGGLREVARSTGESPDTIVSDVLPLSFRLIESGPLHTIHIKHLKDGREWIVEARKKR